MKAEFGFEGSYSNVRRYVQKGKNKKIANSKVYMVLTTLPAEEAQVDFGYIGKIKVDGKFKKSMGIYNGFKLFKIYVCRDSI